MDFGGEILAVTAKLCQPKTVKMAVLAS